MCIFAKPVETVTDTNLFASFADSGCQNLAYQMVFKSKEINAMILPIPVADQRDDAVEFVSLKDYQRFFADLDNGFPHLRAAKSKSRYWGSVDLAAKVDTIKVHDVGDFVASFVPSVKDFARLDKQFVLPKSTWDKIPAYAKYGFAVFQLKQIEGKPHPMAFRFKSSLKDQLFFPTVHIHDGEVHSREEFDHTLYAQDRRIDAVTGDYQNATVPDQNTGWIRSQDVAGKFSKTKKTATMVDPKLLVHRRIMKGKLKNQDVVLKLNSIGNRAKGWKVGSFGWMTPATMALLGLGWFFNRRDEVQQNTAEDAERDTSA